MGKTSTVARVPKYIRLADTLREQVRAGVLKPGDQLPSYTQLQSQYGVAQATLDRVYSLLEKEKLIVRAPKLGTFVADTLRPPRTGVLGFAAGLHPAAHPYYADLLRGAQAAAQAEHHELLLLHENSVVHAERMDGVILAGALLTMPQAMPSVAVMTSAGAAMGVVSDDYGGMTLAVEHLLELGHRRIAFLTDALTEEAGPLSLRRLRAYEDTMSRAGIEVGRQWVRCLFGKWELFHSFDWAGHTRISEWLHDGWRQLGCTALIAHNDEAALGAIRAFAEAGIEVPAQVSVVGFDGIETIGMGGPTLTTVEVPLFEIGAEAVRRLLHQLQCAAEGRPVPDCAGGLNQLPTALRPGASTAAAAGRSQQRPMPGRQGEL